jgi:hypothetical protein
VVSLNPIYDAVYTNTFCLYILVIASVVSLNPIYDAVYTNTFWSLYSCHCICGVTEFYLRHGLQEHILSDCRPTSVSDCKSCNLCFVISECLYHLPVIFSKMVPSSGPLMLLTTQNETVVTNWPICMKSCVDVSPSCFRVPT